MLPVGIWYLISVDAGGCIYEHKMLFSCQAFAPLFCEASGSCNRKQHGKGHCQFLKHKGLEGFLLHYVCTADYIDHLEVLKSALAAEPFYYTTYAQQITSIIWKY